MNQRQWEEKCKEGKKGKRLRFREVGEQPEVTQYDLLPSPGWALWFPKDKGPPVHRWPWMAELGGEGRQ